MNQREKILAAAVGGLLVVIGLFFVVRQVSDGNTRRAQRLAAVQSEVQSKQNIINMGNQAQERLRELGQRSLPRDARHPEAGRNLYQKWLLERVEKSGLADVKFSPAAASRPLDAFDASGFKLTGRGTLEQIVRLMHDLASVNCLHSVRRMQLEPVKDKLKEVDVTLDLEAAILKAAPDKTEALAPKAAVAQTNVKEYLDPILKRNLFGPPNAPPKFGLVSAQTAYVGKSFSYSLRASDPDKDDKLSFSLEGDAPVGLKLDARSGELRWTPADKGKIKLHVVVADTGVPSKTDQATLEISVSDPPPPPEVKPVVDTPKVRSFEKSKYAVISGIVAVDGRWEVWLRLRNSDETMHLHEGDKFEFDGFHWEVQKIGEQDVILRYDKKRMLLSIGESLDKGQPLPEGDI